MLRALFIAVKAHSGQKDKGGKPYILHPLRVASRVKGEKCKQVALLHDVVEDTCITTDALRRKGIVEEVVVAVEAITKRDGEAYEDYLTRVKGNEMARAVKISDLLHNSDLTRLKFIGARDVERVQKYMASLKYLISD